MTPDNTKNSKAKYRKP